MIAMTDPQARRLALAYLAFDKTNRELPTYERNGNRQEARDCRRRIADSELELDAAVAAIAEGEGA
jgi:hypothetical protein